jgi:hopanoid-associated phosphorylase
MAYEAPFADATLAQTLLGHHNGTNQLAEHSVDEQRRIIIAFVGMAFEARIAAGPNILVLSRDCRRELAAAAESAARHGHRGIISFGVACGLVSSLRTGDWVVASAIVQSQVARMTNATWSQNLLDVIGGAHYAPIVGVDAPVADPAQKRELHRRTGAAAADMESHVVAEVAAAHGLAFAALRVIVDPVERAIPRAALAGIGTSARADGTAVLRDLLARPSQLPSLIRVSWDAFLARSEMIRVRRSLGPHFGLSNFDHGSRAGSPDEFADTDAHNVVSNI